MKPFVFIYLLIAVQTAYSQSALRNLLEVYGTPGSNMTLGTGILGLGDINNDGWPDFAVSAHNIGKTFIYFGGPGKLDGIADITLRGGDNMVMGDFNGDGRKDLIIHQGPYTSSQTGVDSIFVYFGKALSPLAIDTIPGLIIAAEKAGEYFGNTVAIGDLNVDGFDDLVIGAPFHGRGKLYVYLGRSVPLSVPDFAVTEADTSKRSFGFNVGIADINGDGISDLVIGSGGFDNSEKTLDIHYGCKGWTFTKEEYSQRLSSQTFPVKYLFQFSLCDVNVDGKADLVLFGVKSDSLLYFDRTLFFYGGRDSILYTPDLIFTSPDSTRWGAFAGTCFDIGDINGDGKKDFVLGAFPGGGPAATILVYFGLPNPVNKPVAVRSKGAITTAFNYVVGVGDIDGNGVNDFATVAPYAYQAISQDGYFVILSGDKTFTDVNDKEEIPSEFSLSQNYPNPFNPSTTVTYDLPRESNVLLKVYDLMGRELATLVNERQFAGRYQITFNPNRLASGAYIYQLQAGSSIDRKKMLYVK